MSRREDDAELRWRVFRDAMARGPQPATGKRAPEIELGVPFRRTPGEWGPMQIIQDLVMAGWKPWEVIEPLRRQVEYWESAVGDGEFGFHANSFALGYISACVAIGRGMRDQVTDAE